jgi:CBS domain-containing protein
MRWILNFQKNIDFVAYITQDTTLGEALQMIVDQRVHRLYICDNKKPIGVFTLTDLFALLMS